MVSLTAGGVYSSKVTYLVADELMLVVGRIHWLLSLKVVLLDGLGVLMTWQIASLKESNSSKQNGICNIFCDLISEITHRHSCNILLVILVNRI